MSKPSIDTSVPDDEWDALLPSLLPFPSSSASVPSLLLSSSSSSSGEFHVSSRKAYLMIGHCYIMENGSKGFCESRLDVSYLTEDQLWKLQSARFPKDKWTEIFSSIADGMISEWLENDPCDKSQVSSEVMAKPDQVPSLLLSSPKAANPKTGIFGVFPALSYEDDAVSNGVILGDEGANPTDKISQAMREFKQRFGRIKESGLLLCRISRPVTF